MHERQKPGSASFWFTKLAIMMLPRVHWKTFASDAFSHRTKSRSAAIATPSTCPSPPHSGWRVMVREASSQPAVSGPKMRSVLQACTAHTSVIEV